MPKEDDIKTFSIYLITNDRVKKRTIKDTETGTLVNYVVTDGKDKFKITYYDKWDKIYIAFKV